MKSTILIQLTALPAILASIHVGIMNKEVHKDVSVTGIMNKDKEPFTMSNSATEVDKTVLCLVDGEWTRWGCGGDRDRFYQAGIFNFSKPTTESQDFRVVKFQKFKQDVSLYTLAKKR
jgi:hypothetical protein